MPPRRSSWPAEAEEGGVFRSDDGGDSWRRVNDDRSLRQRAWYYTHIYADTQDEKFAPPELLRRMVAAGALGRKSGQGFYPYG